MQNTSCTIKPLKSRKFRPGRITTILTEHFKKCWENCKSASPKLSFYHSCKTQFVREPYLDLCKGFSRRYSTTKLRISSHDLQIERGRYHNVPREQRNCEWCKTSMGLDTIENETHFLFNCDLYQDLRIKLINNLKKLPRIAECEIIDTNINLFPKDLKSTLLQFLSPYGPECQPTSPISHIHSHSDLMIEPNTPAFTSFLERRRYVISCVCTFIFRCTEKRLKFVNELQKSNTRTNSIVFNILRGDPSPM